MSKNILVIATHPDDETLGCGGTLLRHKQEGDNIYWCIVTHYDSSTTSKKILNERLKEIESVAQKYGFNDTFQLPFITTKLDQYTSTELIGTFSDIIRQVQPHTIYLPYQYDVHSDHRITFDTVFSCTKSFRYPYIKRILMMETLSETEFAPVSTPFAPNVFVDISPYMEQKLSAMRIFASELAPHPFPRSERSIIALATLRGSSAGCEYAESFMLIKECL